MPRPAPPSAPPPPPQAPPRGAAGHGPLEALAGQPAPNAAYLGSRLLYEAEAEAPFDPVSNPRYTRELKRQFFVFFVMLFAIYAVGFLVTVIAFVAGGERSGVTALVVFALLWLVAVVVFWFRPFPVLLSEWKISLDGSAPAGQPALEQMIYSLARRRSPVDGVRIRRLQTADGYRDTLVVTDGLFRFFVSCFPYGEDLFIGWHFWLNVSPARWTWMALTRFVRDFGQRNSRLFSVLDFEPARALREVLHAVVREGIDVASGTIAPQGQGTIGSLVAVDVVRQAPVGARPGAAGVRPAAR